MKAPHKFPHYTYTNLREGKKCQNEEHNRSLLAKKRAFRRRVSLVFLLSFLFTPTIFFHSFHLESLFTKPNVDESIRRHRKKNFLKFSTLSSHAFNFFSPEIYFSQCTRNRQKLTPRSSTPNQRVKAKFIRRFSSNQDGHKFKKSYQKFYATTI